MSGFAEYEQFDGLGLAELVGNGDVSSAEVCEAAIERIERLNPKLNAVVVPMYDQGRKQAGGPLPEGPFAGVPLLVKDLHFACAGVPATCGCKALKDHIASHDAELVLRFKKAGAVIVGKTNTPEFGLLGITEPELFGPCRNPWHPGFTPGGSSGGSAAAVASGMVPIASGGDGGGSIRIPSAYCGLFGLKPSRGRNPSGPEHGEVWQGAVQNHVLSRSVRDSAAMLDATHGPDAGAPYEIRPPRQPFLEAVGKAPGRLKIAMNVQSPIGTPVHPRCIMAVEHTARLLEQMGHHIEEAAPQIDGQRLAKSYLAMYFGEVAADIAQIGSLIGRKAGPKDVESLTYTLGLLGETYSAGFFVKTLRQWDHAARQMGRFFKRYDLYLTPTTAHPPAKIGELKPRPAEMLLMNTVNTLKLGWLLKASGIVDGLAKKSLERTPFTQLANLCGLPAMSVPLYRTPENLPLGTQFIGPFGSEEMLFQLAGQLESAQPWFNDRPESPS